MANIENINNFLDKDKKENSKKYIVNQSIHISNLNYCSFSPAINLDFNERYYSDSEESKIFIVPKKKNFLSESLSICSDPDTDKNHNVMHCQMPLATSSPINKINYDKNHNNGDKFLSVRQKNQKPFSQMILNNTSNIINSTNQITKPTTVNSQNQNFTGIDSSLSEILQIELSLKMFPAKIEPYLNSLMHDIIQVMNYSMPNKQMTNKSKSINNIIRHSFTIIKLNKSICINNKPDKKYELTLPLVNIDSNVLNILNDKLEYLNKILEPAKWPLNDKKEIQKSIKDLNILKSNDFSKYRNSDNCNDLKLAELTITNFGSINDSFVSIQPDVNDSFDHIRELNKSNASLTPFNHSIVFHESSQFQCLENNSLKYVNEHKNAEFTVFETPNISSSEVQLTSSDKKEVLTSVKDLNILKNDDFLKNHNSDNLGDSKLPKLAKSNLDGINDTLSSVQPEADDSFNHVREFNKPNTLLTPFNNSIVLNESPHDQCVGNNNLKYVNEQANVEFVTPGITSFYNNLQVEAQNTRNHGYSLRKHPKSTDHYYSPYSVKKNSKRIIKTKHDDVFVCRGTGKNKTIVQYKVHSVMKANELMKKICPENINSQNTTNFDISNLKLKKNDKRCLCGIFPSQVPSSWDNSLHKSLHTNLHKLRFNSQITQKNMVIKCNDNGFMYDIIKITKNCDIDGNLKLTLKNVQDFINLELNYSKNTITSYYSIFLAVNPDSKVIGYLEVESLNSACIYQNNRFSDDLIAVKFGVSKLWVMVKFRNNRVATRLLKQLCQDENLKTNDIAFAFHGNHGISFIKKFFANDSILIY